MTKVAMPDPVILRTVMPDDYRYGHVYGYTSGHMKAYAAAKVREALEQAIAICDEAYEQARFEYHASCNPYFEGGGDAAESIESRIRALIPPLPGPAEP